MVSADLCQMLHCSLANLLFVRQHLPLTAQRYFKMLDATVLGAVNNSPNQYEHLIIINIQLPN